MQDFGLTKALFAAAAAAIFFVTKTPQAIVDTHNIPVAAIVVGTTVVGSVRNELRNIGKIRAHKKLDRERPSFLPPRVACLVGEFSLHSQRLTYLVLFGKVNLHAAADCSCCLLLQASLSQRYDRQRERVRESSVRCTSARRRSPVTTRHRPNDAKSRTSAAQTASNYAQGARKIHFSKSRGQRYFHGRARAATSSSTDYIYVKYDYS